MRHEISRQDMMEIATALFESRDMDSLLRHCLPLYMDLSQCSIIGLYCRSKQDMYHISVAPGIFLENPRKTCLEILERLEIEGYESWVSAFHYNLHCYSFKLQGEWRLLVCLNSPFSPDFFPDFLFLTGLLDKACSSFEYGRTAKVPVERLESLEKTESVFFHLVNHVSSVFWVRERDKMLYLSPGFEMIWKRPAGPVYSDMQEFYRSIHVDDRDEVFRRIQEDFFSSEVIEAEFRIVLPEDAVRWIRVRSYPVIENGGVKKRAGIAEDITSEKAMLLQLEEFRSRLEQMVEEKTGSLVFLNQRLQQEIEDRKELQKKLVKSNALFKSFIDSLVHPAFLVDFDGSMLALNRSFAGAFGTSPGSIAGCNAFYFLEWERFEYYMDRIQKVLCTGKPLRFEEKIGDAHFQVQISPVVEDSGQVFRAVFYFNDISELVQAREELRKSWLRLCAVVDSLPVLVHAHDESDNFVFWNKESERVLGYTSKEMQQNPRAFDILYPDKDLKQKARECWDNYDGKNPCALEVMDKSGRLKIIEWSRLSSKYPIAGWKEWEAGLDVTEKRASEKELVKAVRETEKANQVKSSFLANISHEVRTPISGIIGLSAMLLKSYPDGEQKRNVQNIAKLANDLLQIVNEILDFSKLESGGYGLEKQDFSLDTVFEDIAVALHGQILEKDLEFKTVREKDVPLYLRGDGYIIKRVLLNLVSNAVKFTDAGNVTLGASLFNSSKDNLEILFVVVDSGMGIPLERQDEIFEPFVQVEKGFSRRQGGTGLGLAICKSLVEMMNGAVWVESTPGEGSRFFVRVPLEPGEQIMLESRSAQRSRVLEGRKLKVLLVEDFPVNQEIMVHMLGELGHEVTVRSNGPEALEDLEQGGRYDLVLMDLQMPFMDGFEVTARIRRHADAGISGVPVIALTAHTANRNIDHAYEIGMNGYLLKPVTPDELSKAIHGLFSDV